MSFISANAARTFACSKYQDGQEEVSLVKTLEHEQSFEVQNATTSQSLCMLSCPQSNCGLLLVVLPAVQLWTAAAAVTGLM